MRLKRLDMMYLVSPRYSMETKKCGCAKSDEEVHLQVGYQKEKTAIINRLNRIEGQVRGVRGMVEKEVYCDDILNQITAVQSALKSVSRVIFENHVKSCIAEKMVQGDEEAIDELLFTMEKMMRY